MENEKELEYCLLNNYDVNGKNENDIKKLLSIFQFNLSGKTDYIYINHYITAHKNVPLWIMVQILTLGQFAHMFDYLKAATPIHVCMDYHNITRNQMHSFLSVMTKHRNVCAHGDRFYSYRTKDSISDTVIHHKLKISQHDGRYIQGKNDIFAEVIILKYLLDREDFRDFQRELSRCFKNYNPGEDIIEKMGFPENWKKVIRYSV